MSGGRGIKSLRKEKDINEFPWSVEKRLGLEKMLNVYLMIVVMNLG